MSEIVGVLVLDAEKVYDRFQAAALADAVLFPEQYVKDALFYMANGMYIMHYVTVPEYDSHIDRLDSAYAQQQHHSGLDSVWPFSRSMAPGDAAVLKDKTVWVLTGRGWKQING